MIDSGTLLQGRFLIEDKVGVGGMGAVYRAVDQKFGSQVAIKETFYGDTNLAEAFEREARLLNGLHHAILPHVSDYFSENGGHFLVMEYIEGEDMSEILRRGDVLPVSTVLGWALDLLDGLDYLHSQDPPVIHRDIKPNNLKLTSRGKIMLLDFGMAKETSSNTLGAQSVFGYSRRYSPLEQIEGTGTDERSDIFSLGASIYHLITGQAAIDVLARASAIVAGRPDPLVPANVISPEVPEPVAAILSSALSLNAEYRFESARAMSTALEYVISSTALEQARHRDTPVPVMSAPIAAREEIDLEPSPLSATALTERIDDPEAEDHLDITEPVFLDTSSDGKETATTPDAAAVASTGFLASTRSASPEGGAVRIRRPRRTGSAVWLPVLLACLALVLYGAYRGFTGGDNEPAETPEVAATAGAEPASTDAAAAVTPQSEEEGAGPGSIDESAATDDADQRKTQTTMRPATPRRAVLDDESPNDAGEIGVEPAPAKRAERKAQTQKGADRPARRAVRPAFEQPSVSSIEMIMTGVPYERGRRADERDVWIDDELRERRRMRRMMRRNARPF